MKGQEIESSNEDSDSGGSSEDYSEESEDDSDKEKEDEDDEDDQEDGEDEEEEGSDEGSSGGEDEGSGSDEADEDNIDESSKLLKSNKLPVILENEKELDVEPNLTISLPNSDKVGSPKEQEIRNESETKNVSVVQRSISFASNPFGSPLSPSEANSVELSRINSVNPVGTKSVDPSTKSPVKEPVSNKLQSNAFSPLVSTKSKKVREKARDLQLSKVTIDHCINYCISKC